MLAPNVESEGAEPLLAKLPLDLRVGGQRT